MRPPCSSTIRLVIARPRPVPPFLRVLELSTCWNSLEDPRLVLGGDADAGVGDRDHEAAALDLRPDAHRARVGELDRVADQVHQHLGDPALVAAAGAADRPARRPRAPAASRPPAPRSRSPPRARARASSSRPATSVSWPASILDRSSTSLIRPSRWRPFCWIRSSTSWILAGTSP